MGNHNQPNFFMTDPHQASQNGKETDYKLLIREYVLEKWWVYVLFLTIGWGVAYVYSMTLQPQYEISARLLIKEGERETLAEEEWFKRSLNLSAVSENVFNEIEILSSHSIIRPVIEELGLDVSYFRKEGLRMKEGYQNFPIQVTGYSLQPIKNKEFRVTPLDSTSFELHQDTLIGVYRFDEFFTNSFGSFRITATDKTTIAKNKNLFIKFNHLQKLTESYAKRLNIDFTHKNSTVLDLSLKDQVSRRGVHILEGIIEKYNALKAEESNKIALNTMTFINERLNDISSDLSGAEKSIEQYKLDNNIAFETTSDLDILMNKTTDLIEQQEQIKQQIKSLAMLKLMVSKSASSESDPITSINLPIPNEELRELVQNYNQLLLQRQQLLQTGSMKNPVVQSASEKLTSLRYSIFDGIDKMQKELNYQYDNTKIQYSNASKKLQSVPSKERALLDKSRRQAITEDLYVYMLQKKEETALALISNPVSSQVVEPPHSSLGPVGPNKKLIYLSGIMAGATVPFFLILILNLFKDSLNSEEELKTIFPNQPIIGRINKNQGMGKRIILSDKTAIVNERFRSLRTSLQLRLGEELQTVMVTSSSSSEGKTFISLNLAISFARASKKTLILDFDMRNPDIANYLGKNSDTGLISFFKEEMDCKDLIQSSTEYPNLSFLAGGLKQKNPSDYITSKKLAQLFGALKQQFDIIIIDTPPIGIVSDALLLNDYVDQSLFVVRSGITKKAIIEHTKELFKQNQLSNPALVFNGAKLGEIKAFQRYAY